MQTHVYANNLEIACKAAGTDGTSPQAFPDLCWSPPSPSAGPVVLPYPNTTFAKDITNGTATVFICGQEVAIEDQSYFSTSIGNEPATETFDKGIATTVITGKGYFTQWSSDVVFEGFGVPRHTDMVGHNQGSTPSNTALFPYVSRSFWGHDCKKEEDRIKKACEPEKDQSESKKTLRKESKLKKLLNKKRPANSGKGRRDKKAWHWTDDHCDGLHVALDSMEKAKEYANEMEEVFNSIPDELNILGAIEDELKDMALNAGLKAGGKWVAKAGLKQAAGTSVPLAGNIAMAAWSVYDGICAISEVSEIKAAAEQALEQLDVLKSKATEITDLSKEFENYSNLSDEDQLKKAQELSTQGQDLLATANDCTRARKCNLVPYKADGLGNPMGKRKVSKVESANNGGCCPGQTGHHLIPEASVKGACPNYDHGAAPTVCAEGTSQNMGSHKRLHQALAGEHQTLAADGKIAPDGSMSMDDAMDAAADSHQDAFPASKCSKKCIRAQLEPYYRTCRGGRPSMVDEQAKPCIPGNGPL
ncbi:MAG: DUF4150 domain-containing protein [Candidatus Thiodiazotropha sp. (ex Lucinoma kastoroae)]|nr:DUF4150 domain-containing protein [Candidatus Thiodiazotropha sp. (ex Lucinoma kastoroae)]